MAKSRRAKNPEETERIEKEIGKPRGPIKYSIELNEEQKEGKRVILENTITTITGRAGSGKAQPLTSKILTPDGWILMGDIKVGDKVITQSGKVTMVDGVFPQGQKEIFKVTFSDGSSTECCKEHLWAVKDYKSRNKWRGKHSNLKKVETEFTVLALQDLIDKLEYSKRINFSIPVVSPVEFNEKVLPIDPYFLGLILGDGGITQTITYSSNDEELIAFVEEYVQKLGCTLKVKPSSVNKKFKEFSISSDRGKPNEILNIFRELNLLGKKSEEKNIPEIYKYSTVENRINLLRGLMDTDGSTTGISTTFHTSSSQLRDDIIEIVRSIGGIATCSTKIPKYKYKGKIYEGLPAYGICVCLDNINPFRLSRKADKYINKTKYKPIRYITGITSIGFKEAQCISVSDESHLYITDDYIVTHNTQLAVITALDLLFKKEIKKIFITRPTVAREDLGFLPGDISEKLDPFLIPIYDCLNRCYNEEKIKALLASNTIEIAPVAFMRGRTIEDAILILDEAQNIDNESLKMCLTRIGKTGKIVLCGDKAQIDLKKKFLSGLEFIVYISDKVKSMAHVDLKQNHRNEIVDEILKQYEIKEANDNLNKLMR